MKKIKKLLFSLILFMFYANVTNATTKGTYVAETNNSGKGFLVLIGVVLITLVIILGYKLDKKDELKERAKTRKKVSESKIESDSKVDNDIDDINNNDFQELEKVEFVNQEQEKPKTNHVADDTVMINYSDLIRLENENKEINESYVKTEQETENDEHVYNKIKMESTMIINNTKDEEIEENSELEEERKTISAEEMDEDLDLLELEKAIKEANIRRYTRKKKKVKKHVKRFTRKKVPQVQRESEELEEDEVINKPKKRGRPAKVKDETVQISKRGRGRPRKIKEEDTVKKEPKKRGRPAKVKDEAVQTPKRGRGRPRKNS